MSKKRTKSDSVQYKQNNYLVQSQVKNVYEIDQVHELGNLSSTLTSDGRSDPEIKRTIAIENTTFIEKRGS